MKKHHTTVSGKTNLYTCAGVGLLTALAVSFGLIIGITSLVQNGTLIGASMISVFFVRVISTVVGCLIAAGLCNQKNIIIIAFVPVAYLLALLGLGVILFDETVEKLVPGILSVLLGVIIVVLIKLKPQTKRKKAVRFIK